MKMTFFLLACSNAILVPSLSANIIITSNFESGSIGEITQQDSRHFNLALKNDNLDDSLPDNWRNWWYVKVQENEEKLTPVHFNISNLGWPYFYVPAYSYDNKTWHRVDEKDVSQSPECDEGIENCILFLKKSLYQHQVYLAAFIPYTFTQLKSYVNKISNHPMVKIETLGYSTHYNLPLQHIIITDHQSAQQQARVWIHARSHPGETPGNFILEGLIDFLLSEDALAKKLRENVIFHIIPMHNPDGVSIGNYRSNPESINFEVSWLFDKANPINLLPNAPAEHKMMNAIMSSLLNDKIPVKMALNLHASNSEPETAIFSFPHFGEDPAKYTQKEINLWNNQLQFLRYLTFFYDHRVELPPAEGFNDFLDYYYPETWWWYNKQDDVMAMTLEATYGKAGFDHWVTDQEQRDFGIALSKAIATYLALDNAPTLPLDYKDSRQRRSSVIYSRGFEEITKGAKPLASLNKSQVNSLNETEKNRLFQNP